MPPKCSNCKKSYASFLLMTSDRKTYSESNDQLCIECARGKRPEMFVIKKEVMKR